MSAVKWLWLLIVGGLAAVAWLVGFAGIMFCAGALTIVVQSGAEMASWQNLLALVSAALLFAAGPTFIVSLTLAVAMVRTQRPLGS